MAVLDRTWYGRVLVERVEGFATEEQWRRAYEEIGGFERTLADEGTIIVKLWLHISPEEQLRRFQARASDPLKAWKLTPEDWENRRRRPEYQAAVEEMFERTEAPHAPWQVIAAESKRHARVSVVRTVIEQAEAGMRRWGQAPPPPG
jgi:polyphosphate kinase 2 (PPK2 family)